MELQDFLMKQIQQFMQAILRRLLDLMDLISFEGQDAFASELVAILEQMSGLDRRTLEETEARALAYLLNIRLEGENKLIMAAVLRLQATLAQRDPAYGSAERWEKIAGLVEKEAAGAVVSRTTEGLLRQLEEKRRELG